MTTILFVDDNRNVCEYCRAELEEEGYSVVVAGDGEKALWLVESRRPDLVILDICMPGMNGLEAAAQMRAIQDDLPIIFFTSYDYACTQDQRSSCATACVEKRADLTELKNAIVAVVRSRREGMPYRLGLPPAPLSAATTI